MTDVASLKAEVDQLRVEVRRIKTTQLRADVATLQADVAALDHGLDLAGLADDDHPQYQLLTDSDWGPWTPSYTNITLGNGIVVARYAQENKLVVGHFTLTFGSSTTIDGANPAFSAPVSFASSYLANGAHPIGPVFFLDDTGTNYDGVARVWSSNRIIFQVYDASATYVKQGTVTATVPYTWDTSDVLHCSFAYEGA